MLIRRPGDIAPSEITPRPLFDERRRFIQVAGAGLAVGALGLPITGNAGQPLEGVLQIARRHAPGQPVRVLVIDGRWRRFGRR